ncbi:MAG: cupin domain-containing protein [Nitrospirales bacterium]
MIHQDPSDEILEKAALYALGALDGEERESFEKVVADGCATCQAVKGFQNVAELLGTSITPKVPPASLRTKLLECVEAEQQFDPKAKETIAKPSELSSDTGFTFVRAQDDLWHDIGSGIRVKVLSFDQTQNRLTALARMEPHSAFRPHEHPGPEEFYVLEGTCNIGGQLLHVGDYHRAESGTYHHETSTVDGCLMLTMFSPSSQMLQALT